MSSKIEYRLKIEHVFRFADGSKVLVCRLLEGDDVPIPTTAALLVEGTPLGEVRLTTVRMLGPEQGANYRNVVPNAKIGVDVEHHECMLVPAAAK